MPASRRRRVDQSVRSVPPTLIRPDSSARMPMMASTSSAWPLPSTPAMPRTSPRWILKEMSSISARPAADRTVRPSALSSTWSVTVDSRVSGVGSSLPTISSASWRAVTLFGSTVATVVPRRITVISSATSSTSSSLCEMKMTVRPSLLSSRRLSKSSSTSCGTSTAVGSSRIRIFAPR